jgi:small subunit ribosomal protein S7
MRKFTSKNKIYEPDPKYNTSIVSRIVNHIMKNGKKIQAYNIFYDAMDKIDEYKKNTDDQSSISLLKKALQNLMPLIEVRTIRRGGSSIQIPIPISTNVRITKAIKLLINAAKDRNEKTMSSKLALEIMAAAKEEGAAFKKKQNIHKMAEANKAFSHLMTNSSVWQKN